MIFISRNQLNQPIRGYVNKIFEHEGNNGGKIKTYSVGTTEKKQDGTKVYSTWYCNVIGSARQKEDQLQENTPIDIWGAKFTNVAKKDEATGKWSKPYLNVAISDFDVHTFEPRSDSVPEEEKPY